MFVCTAMECEHGELQSTQKGVATEDPLGILLLYLVLSATFTRLLWAITDSIILEGNDHRALLYSRRSINVIAKIIVHTNTTILELVHVPPSASLLHHQSSSR
jgi:hypothetical protein